MKIAVTGGAGFIGHHLVAHLLQAGHAVTVLDNLRRASFERAELAGARCLEGDVRERAACVEAFREADAVVHLAAQSNVMGSEADPDYTYATNVTGTWNVAVAARECGVGHVVFASSREVYGDAATLPVPETAPFKPHNLYGASKVAGEVLLGALSAGGPAVSIVRLSNVIGRGDSGRVVPLWLKAAAEGCPLTVFGGEQVMDLVPVGFVCKALERVLHLGPLDAPLNIGSGRETRILDLARHIVALTESPSAIEVVPPRGPEVTRFCADVSGLRAELGLEPPLDPLAAIEADW